MENEKEAVIGVDMGGTNVRLALVTDRARILERVRYANDTHNGPEGVIEELVRHVGAVMNRAGEAGVKVTGVALGVPGHLLPEEGIVILSPNLPGWVNYDLKAALSRRIHVPVIIDNDANMCALGEKWQGAGRDYDDFLCMTLGTGVGGGLILNGKLWHGRWGSGGEIGHVVVNSQGGLCSCGNRGCLESEASASAIRRKALEALGRGVRSDLEKFTECTELLTAEAVADAASAGDELALSIYRDVGTWLGRAIVNTMNLLGLQAFVVGGGVSAAWDLFYPEILEEVKRTSRLFPPDCYHILRVRCGEDAGILGAARTGFGTFFAPTAEMSDSPPGWKSVVL